MARGACLDMKSAIVHTADSSVSNAARVDLLKSCYDYCYEESLPTIFESQRALLQTGGSLRELSQCEFDADTVAGPFLELVETRAIAMECISNTIKHQSV